MISEFFKGAELALRVSESESRRFGFEVSRLAIPIADPTSDQQVARLVGDSSSELVIVRADTRRLELSRALTSIDGADVIHADTLSYFRWVLGGRTTLPRESARFAISQSNSFDVLVDVLRVSFHGYRNHYSANPRLAKSVTVAAYEEWGSRLMQDITTRAFVARETADSEVIGFVLLMLDEARGFAEVVLNAVDPKSQRRGVYSALMSTASDFLKEHGSIDDLYISTQQGNSAVIQAWRTLGLDPYIDLNTFHVTRGDA